MQKLNKCGIFHNIKNSLHKNWNQQVVSNRRRNASINGIIWMIKFTSYFVA